jgi:hypothetical protein
VTNPEVEVAETGEVSEADAAAFFDKLLSEPQEAPAEEEDDAPETEDEADEPAAEEEGESESKDQADEPEAEEVAVEGKTFKVPKEVAEIVKKADSLQADYTRKTQEVAERRKVVEDRQQYLEAKEQLLGSAFNEAAELHALQQQLKQFDGLNWSELIDQDAPHALRMQVMRQQIAQQLQSQQNKVQAAIGQVQQAQALHKQKQMELGHAELQRRLGQIKDQDRQAMLQTAQELGFEEGDMMNPRALHALHLAAKYMTLQKSKPQVTKRVAEAKPMKTVARSAPQAQRDGSLADLADKAKRTGKDAYAAAFFERKFGRN